MVILCAQLSAEGDIRYSKAIKEHSSVMWAWTYADFNKSNHLIEIITHKARNQKAFNFYLKEDFDKMSFTDLSADEILALKHASTSAGKDKNKKNSNQKSKDDSYFDV